MIGAIRLNMPLLSIGRRVRFRHLMRTLDGLAEPTDILDAGCGDGRFARSLAARYPGASVVAVDADAKAIESNRRRDRDPIIWSVGEVGSMSLPDAHFELVVCVDVLEHVRDDTAALRWLAGRVAPGGTLILHVPAAAQRHLRSVGVALSNEIRAGEGPHFREGYERDDLRRLLERSGLEVESVTSTFHSAAVRMAVDLETWLYLRRVRWLKALILPALMAAGAVERRASAQRAGNGCLALARRPDPAKT